MDSLPFARRALPFRCVRLSICLALLSVAASGQTPELVIERVHTERVHSVVFSPDGQLLASLSHDETLKLWDAKSFREIRTLALPCKSISFVSNKSLLCALDQKISVIDLASGQQTHELKFKQGVRGEMRLARSSNSLIVTGRDGIVRQFAYPTGDELFSFETSPGGDAEEKGAFVLSPDGRLLAVVDSPSHSTLWDVPRRRRLRSFDTSVEDGDFSKDGKMLAFPASSHIALWRFGQNKLSYPLKLPSLNYGTRVLFSPVDSTLAVSSKAVLRLWDPRTGKEQGFDINTGERPRPTVWDALRIRPSPAFGEISSIAFSPDGRLIAGGTAPRRRPGPSPLKIYDLRSRLVFETTSTRTPQVYSANFDSKGELLASAVGDEIRLWNLTTGRVEETLRGQDEINAVVFSPTEDVVASGSDAYRRSLGRIIRWNTVSAESIGIEVIGDVVEVGPHPILRTSSHITALAYSNDGATLASGGREFRGGQGNLVVLWNARDGRATRVLGQHAEAVSAIAFTRSGNFLVSGSLTKDEDSPGEINIWQLSDGNLAKKLDKASAPFAIDDDAGVLATRNALGGVQLWNLDKQSPLRELPATGSPITALGYSRKGEFLIGGQRDGAIVVWDTKNGYRAKRFPGHSASVRAIAFRPGNSNSNELVATVGDDATIHLWKLDSEAQLSALGSLFSFENGAWAVVTPDGRFDTNDVEQINGLHWIFPDDRFRALSAEIFMRDYYEPRLLPRLLASDDFRQVPQLTDLNRVQPKVTITQVRKDGPDTAAVTVEVENVSRTDDRSRNATVQSGAKDLRLFRDGQLVSYRDGDLLAPQPSAKGRCLPIARRAKKCRAVFDHIKLPSQAGVTDVEFSAYAFNPSDVKSETFRFPFKFRPRLATRKGSVYLVTVGVSNYENDDWNLDFAANDAHLIDETVGAKLRATGDYDDVVSVMLTSEERVVNGRRELVKSATKDNFKKILRMLAGEKLADAETKDIPNARQIKKATPEDVVMIFYSSHGYRDDERFYLFPFDIGEGTGRDPEAVVPKAISSDDLYLWLRDIDAGDILLVIDSCHAAAVTGREFKPGPMGSRGMGQLAYDKGMRILAATQPDTTAAEVDSLDQRRKIQHGLLTYALVADGLIDRRADMNDDNVVMMSEWLEFGLADVPMLFKEAAKSQNANAENATAKNDNTPKPVARSQQRGAGTVRFISRGDGDTSTQQPSLFDFTSKLRRKRQLVVQK